MSFLALCDGERRPCRQSTDLHSALRLEGIGRNATQTGELRIPLKLPRNPMSSTMFVGSENTCGRLPLLAMIRPALGLEIFSLPCCHWYAKA